MLQNFKNLTPKLEPLPFVGDTALCAAIAERGSNPSKALPRGPILRGSDPREVPALAEEALLFVAFDTDFLSTFFTSDTSKIEKNLICNMKQCSSFFYVLLNNMTGRHVMMMHVQRYTVQLHYEISSL